MVSSTEPTVNLTFTYGELNYILCAVEVMRTEYREEAKDLRGWGDRGKRAMNHAKSLTPIIAKLRRKERAMRSAS